MKKAQDVCTQEEPCDWILRLTSHQRWHTCEACREAERSRQLEHCLLFPLKAKGFKHSLNIYEEITLMYMRLLVNMMIKMPPKNCST